MAERRARSNSSAEMRRLRSEHAALFGADAAIPEVDAEAWLRERIEAGAKERTTWRQRYEEVVGRAPRGRKSGNIAWLKAEVAAAERPAFVQKFSKGDKVSCWRDAQDHTRPAGWFHATVTQVTKSKMRVRFDDLPAKQGRWVDRPTLVRDLEPERDEEEDAQVLRERAAVKRRLSGIAEAPEEEDRALTEVAAAAAAAPASAEGPSRTRRRIEEPGPPEQAQRGPPSRAPTFFTMPEARPSAMWSRPPPAAAATATAVAAHGAATTSTASSLGRLPTKLRTGFEDASPARGARLEVEDVLPRRRLQQQQRGVANARGAADAGHNPCAGPQWFDMTAPERTPQVEADLKAIRLRRVMNPKRFYKANDSKTGPEVFSIGTVIEGSMDGAAGRLTKKERKRTFVDEVLADSGVRHYAGRVFKDVQARKQSGGKRDRRNATNRTRAKWSKR